MKLVLKKIIFGNLNFHISQLFKNTELSVDFFFFIPKGLTNSYFITFKTCFFSEIISHNPSYFQQSKGYCVCLLSITLCNCQSFSSAEHFRNIGEFGVKKYFTDYPTTNTTQLVVTIKGNFFWLIFSQTSHRKGELPRDSLINIATRLFAYH